MAVALLGCVSRRRFDFVEKHASPRTNLNCTVLFLSSFYNCIDYFSVPVPSLNEHHATKAYLGSGGITPRIL
jgi:hypothetical protein